MVLILKGYRYRPASSVAQRRANFRQALQAPKIPHNLDKAAQKIWDAAEYAAATLPLMVADKIDGLVDRFSEFYDEAQGGTLFFSAPSKFDAWLDALAENGMALVDASEAMLPLQDKSMALWQKMSQTIEYLKKTKSSQKLIDQLEDTAQILFYGEK